MPRDEEIDTEVVRKLRSLIGQDIEVGLTATLIGVGNKGINLEIRSAFGTAYQFTAHDFTFVRPAPKAGW